MMSLYFGGVMNLVAPVTVLQLSSHYVKRRGPGFSRFRNRSGGSSSGSGQSGTTGVRAVAARGFRDHYDHAGTKRSSPGPGVPIQSIAPHGPPCHRLLCHDSFPRSFTVAYPSLRTACLVWGPSRPRRHQTGAPVTKGQIPRASPGGTPRVAPRMPSGGGFAITPLVPLHHPPGAGYRVGDHPASAIPPATTAL